MKILRCHPRNWREKVTAILEASDLDVLSLDELVGLLITHEMTVANDDEQVRKEKKIKNIAFKSSIDEDDELSDDEKTKIDLRRPVPRPYVREYRGEHLPKFCGAVHI